MIGKNHSFTFLIPTRKRVESLKKCLNSILINTYNLENIEIILGVDDDDFETMNFDLSYYKKNKINISIIIMNRFSGYEDQPKRLIEMITHSKNDFLIHFADDMEIETKNWDVLINDKISKLNHDLIYLIYPSHNQKNSNWPLCQIISKKWFEITKKFANSFETDTELLIISSLLRRKIKLDNFKILFFRNFDQTYLEGRDKFMRYHYNKKSILSILSLYKILYDYQLLNENINGKNLPKFMRISKIIITFTSKILFIKKHFGINYFYIFLKNLSIFKI